jgi:aspartyl-tRNA(Asn)/glutamyl-tRNA(Gln) amidotransferase subunit A
MTKLTTIAHYEALLNTGELSSAGLVDAALARIAAPEGEGARVFTRVYDDAARAAAAASDLLRGAGRSRSAIDGLPVSIKDLFDVAGETTLAGSVVRQGEPVAGAHAVVVKRLLAAGAVLVGKTNMTEFAYSGLGINPHYGTPKNPWDRASARIPGGSSSGAAVSVSDHMAVAAIGSDTGGSVRIPAALCGLTGFKPTARRVPTRGALPLSVNLDSIGPIAASVACCAELDAILSGQDGGPLPIVCLRGLRLALPTTAVLDGMDAHVAASFEATLKRLSAAGAQLAEFALPAFGEVAAINAQGGFTAAEAWAWHRGPIARAAQRYDPRVVSRIRRGEAISAADYIDLLNARTRWIGEVEAGIAGYDAMLMPTVPVVAPAIAELQASDEAYFSSNALILRNPTMINFLDGCALTLPCQTPGSAPVGLMLAGPAMSDARILAIGLAIEECLRFVS